MTTRRRAESGQIICSRERTNHVLPTQTPELILPGWCLWRYARRRSPRRQDVFTDSGRGVLTMGGTMSKTLRLSLITAVLLFSAFTASAQELPDGPGKELVAAQCNSCHPFHARLGS